MAGGSYQVGEGICGVIDGNTLAGASDIGLGGLRLFGSIYTQRLMGSSGKVSPGKGIGGEASHAPNTVLNEGKIAATDLSQFGNAGKGTPRHNTGAKPDESNTVINTGGLDKQPSIGDNIVVQGKGISKEVEIVNESGSPIGEFDEIDLDKGIFYEDKTAKGLNVINPTTGLTAQTAEEFAEKQIFQKTTKRIENLQIANATRPTINGSQEVPSLSEIKEIKTFVFRLDGNSLELQQAVNESINKLQIKFPDYSFKAEFGER